MSPFRSVISCSGHIWAAFKSLLNMRAVSQHTACQRVVTGHAEATQCLLIRMCNSLNTLCYLAVMLQHMSLYWLGNSGHSQSAYVCEVKSKLLMSLTPMLSLSLSHISHGFFICSYTCITPFPHSKDGENSMAICMTNGKNNTML